MQHEHKGANDENSTGVNILFMLDCSQSDREEEISMKLCFYKMFYI